MDFIGERCPVCGEKFTAEDNIVVCPDCGTPHHKECYAAANKCANEEYHFIGRKWERKVQSKPLYKVCPVCHFPNSNTDTNCQRCGTELNNVAPIASDNNTSTGENEQWRDPFSAENEEMIDPIKYLGLDPDEDMGGASLKEVTDFVGTSTIYYLPRFKRMKDDGVKPSFNIFSLIFPSLYFANRKMWGWAVLAAFLGVIFNIPDLLLGIEDFPDTLASFISANKQMITAFSDICVVADMVVRGLFCFFANWLYFRFAMNSLKKHKTSGRPASMIGMAGGIKPLNMLIITAIKYGIGMMLIAAITCGFEMVSTVRDFSTLCIM
ncbi:RING finger protein [Ruminococcus flavefaciens]|uniref:RING finger protein n=1 Tax=Ruminococcus flavefaciens TaxID=1265 RepID=UPI0026F12000|nr:RING finger protein [Ruminococcus flavefaciens]MDD7517803.1 RING finger protein [Ruminococcus flavefaciens]MDY5692039.1 RING finger protein [Ruminococcus flavefaciens]